MVFVFAFIYRDNLSGADECSAEHQLLADDVCPWDMTDGSDKKRSLPTSIAEERERRLSSTSSSRKNSGGNVAYDSASADESQSDSVASRLRRSCGLGGGDKRRGSSTTCTPQQTVDRPSVSSAEDFDIGLSPESRSPEKPPMSPHEHTTAPSSSSTTSLDAKPNRKKLLKTLSLARKQSITPVINVSSVDRDSGKNIIDETSAAAECSSAFSTGVGGTISPDTAAATTTGTEIEGAMAAVSDGNDVCPWEDE